MLPRLKLSTRFAHNHQVFSARHRILHTTRPTMHSNPSSIGGGKDDPMQQPAEAAKSAPVAATGTTGAKPIEALPAPGEGTSSSHPVLDVSSGGGSISLDAMGPIVVNRDGTISRVQNWGKMTEIEKENTLRVLGKRNQQRLAALTEAEKAQVQGSDGQQDAAVKEQ